MKRFIFILISIVVFKANAQIQIKIDSLELSQISITLHNPSPGTFMNLGYISLLNMGPQAIFHISVRNETDTFLPIYYQEWIFNFLYSYHGKTYNSDFFSFRDTSTKPEPFIYELLIPGQKFSFILKDDVLLDFNIRSNKKDDEYDFCKEMLEIIPTIRVYAISPDRKLYISNAPNHIVIKKNATIKDSNYEYKDVLNVKKFMKKLSKKMLFNPPKATIKTKK